MAKKGEEVKTEMLRLRITPSLKDKIIKKAESLNITLAAYVNMALDQLDQLNLEVKKVARK